MGEKRKWEKRENGNIVEMGIKKKWKKKGKWQTNGSRNKEE